MLSSIHQAVHSDLLAPPSLSEYGFFLLEMTGGGLGLARPKVLDPYDYLHLYTNEKGSELHWCKHIGFLESSSFLARKMGVTASA